MKRKLLDHYRSDINTMNQPNHHHVIELLHNTVSRSSSTSNCGNRILRTYYNNAMILLSLLLLVVLHSPEVFAFQITTSTKMGWQANMKTYNNNNKNKNHHCYNAVDQIRSTCILSSSRSSNDPTDGGGGGDNDELSKLIGKREQIKRNKKIETNAVDEVSTNTEPMIDLDLSKLPEFKVDRPRRIRQDNDSAADTTKDGTTTDGTKKKKGGVAPPPIIDFLADYDDENDLHIPNRIGISTVYWGDTSPVNAVGAGIGGQPYRFVVGKNVKLTKRQIKMGYFVAGDVQLAYEAVLANGVTFIETSPTYGSTSRKDNMSAEQLLGQCIQQHPKELPTCMILTSSGTSALKSFITNQGNLAKGYINSLEQSLQRLSNEKSNNDDMKQSTTKQNNNGKTKKKKKKKSVDNEDDDKDSYESISSIDVFTVPKSFLVPSKRIANGLAMQMESGQTNYVGVEGITNPRTLRKLCRTLDTTEYDNTKITTNSFEYSLTNTKHERMIQICKDLNIIPLICNPYDNGLASGLYTATNPSGGEIGGSSSSSGGGPNTKELFSFKILDKLQPLHSVQETLVNRVKTRVKRSLNQIQERYKSKYGPPPTIEINLIGTKQIALQYIIAKGGVPLVPVNTPNDANDIIGCLGWTLSSEEVDMLDNAVALCKL